MKVNILTKNPGKRRVAKNVFDKYNIHVNFIKKDYPEIQAENSMEIARFTALRAAKDLNIPVIREDHSFYIKALGFPGPYTNYIEKAISARKILNILKSYKDRSGYFEIATVYAEPEGFCKEYSFRVPAKIALQERGGLQRGWARIIQLADEERTLAEYPEEERVFVWGKNYEKIARWILKIKKC